MEERSIMVWSALLFSAIALGGALIVLANRDDDTPLQALARQNIVFVALAVAGPLLILGPFASMLPEEPVLRGALIGGVAFLWVGVLGAVLDRTAVGLKRLAIGAAGYAVGFVLADSLPL
jgi:hypothetical protein